jgi:GAF domain-containing protein
MADAGHIVVEQLGRVIHSALYIFYLYDASTDELESRCCVGDSASEFRGLRFPLGQRLSGWVAANRRSILNSDPILDLGDRVRLMPEPFRSCLSVPLVLDNHLVGVLTLYSMTRDGFSEDDRRIVESASQRIAHVFQKVAAIEDIGRGDASSPSREALLDRKGFATH